MKLLKKDDNKTNNKFMIILRILFWILLDSVIVMLLVFGGIKIINNIKNVSKDELTVYLEDMGKEFYEEFYYEQLGSTLKEKASFLSLYKDIGIKISLETLSKYNGNKFGDIIDKFVNKETNQLCNRNVTKVIIYPKEPYEKDSYKIDTEIEC